ncbi:hypothetical protein DXG03_000339 [Asterophora parasitica]|uniref:Uncharacterized protein n=1 Tax=Asterophora parasitica TaxID=117018 RepID=A0A9P7KHP4_9AGAR|nr:hypothetical protein DXG03_000339 [Asterophora parasitica]
MPQKLQNLEQQNAEWQSENVKLFQDNQSLSRALQENDTKHKATIAALEKQVKLVSREKAHLQKQNEVLVAGQSPAAYQQLLADHQTLQGYYSTAVLELKNLRRHYEGAGRLAQPPATTPTGWLPQNAADVTSNSQQHIPRFSGKKPLLIPSNHMNGAQLAQLVVVKRQVIRASKAKCQAMDGPGSPTGMSSHAAIQSSLSVDTANLVTSPNPGHTQFSPIITSGTTPQRHSLSLSSTPQPGLSNIPQQLSMAGPAPPSVATPLNAPTPIQSRQPTPFTNPLSGALSSLQQDVRPVANASVDPFESPPADACDEPKPTSSEHISADNIHDSVSPDEPTEATTPMDVTPGDASAISIAPHGQGSLKRPGSALSSTEEYHESKKQRLIEDVAAPIEPKTEPDLDVVAKCEEQADEEGSEEGDTELGPDGLRLVEDCLAALIDDDEENEEIQTCKLCMARFIRGLASEPKPFLRATTEQLVEHCSTEHRVAWESLRRPA